MGQLAGLALAVHVVSPNGQVSLDVSSEAGRLTYAVFLDKNAVVEPAPVGVVVDGRNLAAGTQVLRADSYHVDEKYRWYGVHLTAVGGCNGYLVGLTGSAARVRALRRSAPSR